MCFGSVGVTFHERTNVQSISEAVERLFDHLEPECGILVETFIEPVKPKQGKIQFISSCLKK